MTLSTATLAVNFATETSGNGLLLEKHTGFTGLAIGVPIRCYPDCNARFVCEYGEISEPSESRISYEKEIVAFSGGKTATLKKPSASHVSIEVLTKVCFDENGDVIQPAVIFDEVNQQLVADKAFYGAIKVSYQSPYRIVFYQFKTNNYLAGGSILYSDDTIRAYYKTNHAELKISNNFKILSDWRQLYIVETKIVRDIKGVWEYPLSWQQTDSDNKNKKQEDRDSLKSGTFGNYSAHEIDPDVSFTDSRIHQTAKYNVRGDIEVSLKDVSVEEPYSHMTFDQCARLGLVKFYLKFTGKPSWNYGMKDDNIEMQWIQAYLSLDRNAIINELKADYYGIEVG